MIRLFHYVALAGMTANLTALLSLLARVFNDFKPVYFTLLGITILITSLVLIILVVAGQKGVNIPKSIFITSSVILIFILAGGILAWQ